MADNQAIDDIGDSDGRVSPTIESSLRAQQRQTERENRANSRQSRGRSQKEFLRDAKQKLVKRKLERSRPSRGDNRSPMTISPSNESRSRSPIPAPTSSTDAPSRSPIRAPRSSSAGTRSSSAGTDRSRPPSRGPAPRSLPAGTEAPPEQTSDNEAVPLDASSEENDIPNETPPRTPSTPRGTQGRKKSSLVWNHCHLIVDDRGKEVTQCNHCPTNWVLKGSTSTALYHIKHTHRDKLSEADLLKL